MTGRRKGTPCACETDPCSCGSSKGKCIRAINNVSPDPNGDFNVRAGAGISIVQSGDDEITIINSADPNSFVEGDNIDLTPSGDDIEIALTQNPVINGTLTVNGDIIQNGAAYETHAEQIYTRDDYIIMRDGAIAALAPGDYAGFQVKLYDGVNDGRLVIDNSGIARVGDVGDEQPLLTREEAANLNNGALLKWDAVNSKAVDEGTVGDDTHPVKIVNGVATAVTVDLIPITRTTGEDLRSWGHCKWQRQGNIVTVSINNLNVIANGNDQFAFSGLPKTDIGVYYNFELFTFNGQDHALAYLNGTTGEIHYNSVNAIQVFGSFSYITSDP